MINFLALTKYDFLLIFTFLLCYFCYTLAKYKSLKWFSKQSQRWADYWECAWLSQAMPHGCYLWFTIAEINDFPFYLSKILRQYFSFTEVKILVSTLTSTQAKFELSLFTFYWSKNFEYLAEHWWKARRKFRKVQILPRCSGVGRDSGFSRMQSTSQRWRKASCYV